MSEHISEELAMALSALPPDDAERAAAVRHAAGCTACQKLLDEGAALLSLVDRELTPPPVSAALEARVRAAVLTAPRKGLRWEHVALALGALASLLMVWLDAHAGPPAVALGAKCMLIELGAALVPFSFSASAAQRGLIRLVPARLALAAMGGALGAQAFLLIDCPAQGALAHTLPFHFAGVLLATLLGYGGARLLPARRG